MQKEYWVNVYENGVGCRTHATILKAIMYSYIDGGIKDGSWPQIPYRPVYRIHVKMKPEVSQAYDRFFQR